jgi:acetyl esterase
MDDGGYVPARYYRTAGAGQTVIVYVHGGGWSTGDIDTHDEIARALSQDSRCPVLSLGYRLAPEHPFPRPLLDCVAVWNWLHDSPAPALRPIGSVALAGDSAGGNLCAALSHALRELHGPMPVAQLLAYPSLDLTLATSAESLERLGSGYQLTAEQVREFVAYYTPNVEDRRDMLASPILARSHVGLPRTMIVTAGFDPIRDDGDKYASLLVAAGGSVVYLHFGSLLHGFLDIAPIIPAATRARRETFRIFGTLIHDCPAGA